MVQSHDDQWIVDLGGVIVRDYGQVLKIFALMPLVDASRDYAEFPQHSIVNLAYLDTRIARLRY